MRSTLAMNMPIARARSHAAGENVDIDPYDLQILQASSKLTTCLRSSSPR